MWRPKSAARPARGRPGPSAAPLPSPSAAPLRPAEPALPPRPAAVKAPEGRVLLKVKLLSKVLGYPQCIPHPLLQSNQIAIEMILVLNLNL